MSACTEIEPRNPGKVWPHWFPPTDAAWWNVISPEQCTIGFGQRDKPVSGAQRNAYDQNPPGLAVEYFPDADGADNIIPQMPSWADLVEDPDATAMRQLQADHLIALRIKTEWRISAANDEATLKDDLQSHLGGDQTPAQDEE